MEVKRDITFHFFQIQLHLPQHQEDQSTAIFPIKVVANDALAFAHFLYYEKVKSQKLH